MSCFVDEHRGGGGLRLRKRNARLQSADNNRPPDARVGYAIAVAPMLGPDSISDRKRHEEIDGVAGGQTREAGFSNADNHGGYVVQAHHAANDRALRAKSALPVGVAQHN